MTCHCRTEESDEAARNAIKDSGSDSGVDSDTHRTTNDTSLDKTYWIHRAAEVCHCVPRLSVLCKLVHSTAFNAATTI